MVRSRKVSAKRCWSRSSTRADSGQLVTGSFMDYGMPRAEHIPQVIAEHALVPTRTNLLGSKGGSEAGNVGAPPAIINAIIDALSEWDVDDITLPATPERIWSLIHHRPQLSIHHAAGR